jgi:PEGA domain
VYVDGERRGQTPMAAFALQPGSYLIELRNDLYRPYLRTVLIKPGETYRLEVDLRLEGIRK